MSFLYKNKLVYLVIFLLVNVISITYASKKSDIDYNFDANSDSNAFSNHGFDSNSIIDVGASEEIDTFKGYLKLSRTDIHLPGNNGMDIDVINSYTGSRFTDEYVKHKYGYGWHLNTMKLTFITDYLRKKEKPYFVPVPNKEKPHKIHYGFFPLSAILRFMDGSTKMLNVTNYNDKWRHEGFHYAFWPEEALSTDNWMLNNPYKSREMYLFSPDGKKYTFSVDINKERFNLSATLTKIDDLHGNWIKYNYERISFENNPKTDEKYLSSIEANDGRRVDFNYVNLVKNERENHFIVLDTIVANNQVWQYKYELSGFKHKEKNLPILKTVIRPDGTTWEYTYNQSTQWSRLITEVKSPSDLRTVYAYRYYKKDDKDFERIAAKYHFDSNNNKLGQWSYDINQDNVFICPNHQDLNCIKNTVNTESIRKEYIYVTSEKSNKHNKVRRYSHVWSHGLLISSEIYDESKGKNFLIEKTNNQWSSQKISDNRLFFNNKRYDENYRRPILLQQVLNRDNTNYITSYPDYGYDSLGRATLIKENGPSGEKYTQLSYEDYPYNHVFNLLKTQQDGVNLSRYNYNAQGKLLEANINGIVSQYNYHEDGNLSKTIDPKGNFVRYDNYFRGSPQLITYSDNTFEKNKIDNSGYLISHTDANENITNYNYDTLGRVTNIVPSKGLETNIIYNQTTTTTQTGKDKEIIQKDIFGNIISNSKYIGDNLFVKEDYKYDVFGREIFKSKPYKTLNDTASGIYKTYDSLDRIKSIRTQFENQSIESYYNYHAGNVIENINPKGLREFIYYQAYGAPSYKNPVKIINANNIATIINRAQDGLVNSVQRDNITKNYRYNSQRLLSEYIEPETGTTFYEYDSNGNLAKKVNSNGNAIQNEYDSKNRLVATTFNDNTAANYYSYDANGNLLLAKTSDNDWQYQYDSNNNLINSTFNYKNKNYIFEYKYNDYNFLESIIYPSKKIINFNPNEFGQISQVGNFVNDIKHNVKGDILSFNYANGLSFNKTINSRNLPEDFNYQAKNKNININYSYDILNNITKIISPGNQVLDLAYDNLDRLSYVSSSDYSGNIEYDNFDNIVKNAITSADYQYDSQNRLISTKSKDFNSFQYDKAGRIINDSVHNYGYNAQDKLIDVDGIKYSYDANGNKISNSKSIFINNKLGQKLLDITDNKYSEYFYLGSLLVAKTSKDLNNSNQEKVTYFHGDVLNSIIATSDESGNIISQTLHLPFGLESNDANYDKKDIKDKEIAYTGKHKDKASGLYDFSARHYDAKIGRFTTPDPINFTPKNLASFNRYAYANNNPYKYVDPDGKFAWFIFSGILSTANAAAIVHSAYAGYMATGVAGAVGSVAFDMAVGGVAGKVARGAGKAVSSGLKAVAHEEHNFETLSHFVSTANVRTPKNKAVFYSGEGGRDYATLFAFDKGMYTLEMTPGGKYLDSLRLFDYKDHYGMTEGQVRDLWKIISHRYASQTSGNVTAVLNKPELNSIFNTVEYPTLVENKLVFNINIIRF